MTTNPFVLVLCHYIFNKNLFATAIYIIEEATNILKQFCPNINFIQFLLITSNSFCNLDDVAKATESAYCK